MELSPLLKLFFFFLFYYFFFLAQSVISRYIRFTRVSRLAVDVADPASTRFTNYIYIYTIAYIISHPRCRHYGKIVRFLSIGRNRFAIFNHP